VSDTLAGRLAERNRLREQRAARLARLHPADDAGAALEEFLRALTGSAEPVQEPAPAPGAEPGAEPGAVLHFQRPEPAREPTDLRRLPGAGPGLVWALGQAGIACLADLAPLEADELAARLGPIGRLIPAEAWIEIARAAAR
jgi:predicted flap endonuclease-1-like 5' DNA nuclease